MKLDVAILQLSPPDSHGYCTLGTSCDSSKAAADTARIVIAEINEQMPRTHGNNVVPLSRISAFITTNRPLQSHHSEAESDVEAKIGQLIADLVEDGSTLQMGIGALLKAAGLAPSTTEAGRLVDGGGVRVDSSVVSDKGLKLEAGTYIVQVGKRKFAKVTLS